MNYERTYRGPEAFHSDEDHRTMAHKLMEAEAIKRDKKVMGPVSEHLNAMSRDIKSIKGLRDLADSMSEQEEDGNDPANKTPMKKVREKNDRTQAPG